MKHAWLVILLVACVPDLDVDESRLSAPRLLAIRSEPAEARAGETVSLRGLYASEGGVIDEAPLDWAFCVGRPSLAELGPYAAACVAWESEMLVGIGVGATVTGSVPRDACRLFGPDPPPVGAGGAAGRPVDPDPSGGYRIPLRLIEPDDDAIVMAELRVSCGVAGATQATSAAFRRRYRANVAPSIELGITDDEGAPLGASVPIGARVALIASVPPCGEEEAACGGREHYVRYDAASAELVTERESLRIAWYATSGHLAIERSGLSSDATDAPLTNTWIPSGPGEVTLIAVARDDRGAASWATRMITVE